MSGIIAPAIVNYDWVVKTSDPSYLNVSFPFRVRIESIWFTTNQIYNDSAGLWEMGDGSVNMSTTERQLSLCAIKSKNAQKQWTPTENPTDFLFMFGDATWNNEPSVLAKPTMWLGNPDDADGNLGAFGTQPYWGGGRLDLRSTAKTPVEKSHTFNSNWNDENEWNAKTYLADAAIMNTDEILQLFVFDSGGDWSGYLNNGSVTISVAYTGIHDTEKESAPVKPWFPWWDD